METGSVGRLDGDRGQCPLKCSEALASTLDRPKEAIQAVGQPVPTGVGGLFRCGWRLVRPAKRAEHHRRLPTTAARSARPIGWRRGRQHIDSNESHYRSAFEILKWIALQVFRLEQICSHREP